MWKLATLVALLVLSCAPVTPARDLNVPRVRDDSLTFADIGSRAVLAAATRYPKLVEAAPVPPIALTASDGTGLSLVSYRARAVIDGPLAFTELELTFRNPRNEQVEGRFEVSLPPSAAVSRLAMRIGDRWQEAEVVEKQHARKSYEAILHDGFDPALLEKKAGNTFAARIFPIAAGADKAIILSYSHNLDGVAYRLPLRGLPLIERVDVAAQVRHDGDWQRHRLQEQIYAPPSDFVVPAPVASSALRHGNLVAFVVRPSLDAREQRLRRIAVLFDTSASRAVGFAREVKRLSALLAALRERHGDDCQLELAAFDQAVTPLYVGPIGGFSGGASLLARRPLGASDLSAALVWLGKRDDLDRAILMTDAVATTGISDGGALVRQLKAKRTRVARLDVVLSGATRDHAMARRLAIGALNEDGAVLASHLPAADLARRISHVTRSGIAIGIEGAKWVWPNQLDGVQPGDSHVVFAHLEPGRLGKGALKVQLGGSVDERLSLPVRQAEGPLLARAAAAATIERISEKMTRSQPGAERDFLRQRIVDLSTEYRVLSDHTALLVLETERQYARFGIDRSALVDILVATDDGVRRHHRDGPVIAGVAGGTTSPSPRGPPSPAEVTRSSQRDERRSRTKPKVRRLLQSELRNVERLLEATGDDDDDDDDDGYGYEFSDDPLSPPNLDELSALDPEAAHRPNGRRHDPIDRRQRLEQELRDAYPYEGRMAVVMNKLDPSRCPRPACGEEAIVEALAWQNAEPVDAMAIIALGEALERSGHVALAARAYGSLIDLYAGRAEMLRFAAGRLESLGHHGARLARRAYDASVADRPDHLTAHRARAFARLRQGRAKAAFETLEQAFRRYPSGRFDGGLEVLRQDLALIAAAWIRADPSAEPQIVERLAVRGARLQTRASLRFVLTWETDANDVDLHVFDEGLQHAFHASPDLPSGGKLHHDVTNGFGPELFAIDEPAAYPYRLVVHYYNRGPMGYGMGKVDVVHHDGSGRLTFETRPFVVMKDRAFVDLGAVERPQLP
jgi:tetratricopeptide (TPR) repeat protein